MYPTHDLCVLARICRRDVLVPNFVSLASVSLWATGGSRVESSGQIWQKLFDCPTFRIGACMHSCTVARIQQVASPSFGLPLVKHALCHGSMASHPHTVQLIRQPFNGSASKTEDMRESSAGSK
eukprot:959089-Pleurochrysis_carterae.AAC.1